MPKIIKIKPLTLKTAENFLLLRDKYLSEERAINSRYEYIFKCLSIYANNTLYVDNYSISETLLCKDIGFNSIGCFLPPIFTKDGEEYHFDGGDIAYSMKFPSRWLFEDFEEELSNGRMLYKKHKAKLEKADKADKAKLILSAKAKLTPEELKAVGLK